MQDYKVNVHYDTSTKALLHQNGVLVKLNSHGPIDLARVRQIQANNRIIKCNMSNRPGIQRLLLLKTPTCL
jgi:hypothetical protein